MRKRRMTRRRSAFRWCAAAAVLLAAAWLLLPWNPTLAAAHRRAMEDTLAAPAETLYQTQLSSGRWLVLAQNEDAVCMATYAKAGWLHWRCAYVLTVDREPGRPFAAGHIGDRVPVQDGGGEAEGYQDYVFGCVWDPAVKTLEVRLLRGDEMEQAHEQVRCLKAEDLETNSRGEKWFYVPMELEASSICWDCSVTAYDSQGNSLGRQLVGGVPRWE